MINGLAVMRDEETLSLWDHITGECFEGPMEGARMDFWGVEVTNVAAELNAHPNVRILNSDSRSLKLRVMAAVTGAKFIDSNMNLSHPGVRATMNGDPDPRLPARTQGLGVMDEQHRAKFYPMDAVERGGQIEDEWLGRPLIVRRDATSGVPSAEWADGDAHDNNTHDNNTHDNNTHDNNTHDNNVPMQLLTRWYGFAITYPGCEIYKK